MRLLSDGVILVLLHLLILGREDLFASFFQIVLPLLTWSWFEIWFVTPEIFMII
jgi:hypothetical protein